VVFCNLTAWAFSKVCTGDGWASDIARPIFYGYNIHDEEKYRYNATLAREHGFVGPPLDVGVIIFFLTFIVIVAWTLLQVVVAVLLDNFTSAANDEKERQAREKSDEDGRVPAVFAIDSLLAVLAHFDTAKDLDDRIKCLFEVLDTDDNKTLSFAELQTGFKKLRVNPPIALSREDWDVITVNGTHCNNLDEVDLPNFLLMMRRQLKLYVQRQMSNAVEMVPPENTQASTVLFVLKLLMVSVDELAENGFGSNYDAGSKTGQPLKERMDNLEKKLDDVQV